MLRLVQTVILINFSCGEYLIPQGVDYCQQPSNKIFIEITKYFVEDQHFLTAVETVQNQETKFNTLHCTLNGLRSPVILYTLEGFIHQVEQNQKATANEININAYSQLEGFLSLATYDIFTDYLLPGFSLMNPLAKMILIGRNFTQQEILDLFRLAWLRYDIINLMIVNRVDTETVDSYLFNPYLSQPGDISARNLDCQSLKSVGEVKSYIRYTKQYFYRRTINLHKHPLRIAIGDIDLMSLAIRDKTGKIRRFTYLDGEIVDIMRKKMNFTPDFVILPSQLSTGFIFPNGSLGGSLQLIERDDIDLAANSRIITSYNASKNLQYLRQLTTTKLIFIVPRNYYQSRSKNFVFFNTFTWSIYIVNFLIAAVYPFLLKMVNWIWKDTLNESYFAMAMYTWAVTLAVSTALPKRTYARMILCGIMLYTLITYSLWQAITIKRLNTDNDHLDDIQSLDELIESTLVPMLPVAYAQFLKPPQAKNFTLDSLHQRLYQVAKVVSNNITGAVMITDMLATQSSAVLISDLRAVAVKARFYDEERMQSLVHIIGEHMFEFYTAMALPKDSPFLETFNDITTRCVENGIVAYQLARIEFKGFLYMVEKGKNNSRLGILAGQQRFELAVWKNVFYYYLGLNVLALVVFIVELAVHKRFKGKKLSSEHYEVKSCQSSNKMSNRGRPKTTSIEKRRVLRKRNILTR